MKEKLLKLEAIIVNLPNTIKTLYHNFCIELKIAVEKLKDLASTNYELGLFHIGKGNILDAKLRFKICIKLKKDFMLAHYHLARCYLIESKFDKAKQELEKAIALDPNFILAKYRLKLINHSLEIGADIIPIEIIKEDYNCFAYQYEERMENLNYTAPEQIAQALASHIKQEEVTSLKCLDIGCGTGLAGAYLKKEVAITSLLGIDISANMLELAKTLEIDGQLVYNRTQECDFSNLELLADKFDIILACMSLGYSSDLTTIFKKLCSLTVKDSILGLVVLKSTKTDIEFAYDSACFSFSEKFLKKIFQQSRWTIAHQEETIILDNNVKGLMFVLIKE